MWKTVKKINKQEKRSRLEEDKNANTGIAYYQNYVRFERLSFRKNSFWNIRQV